MWLEMTLYDGKSVIRHAKKFVIFSLNSVNCEFGFQKVRGNLHFASFPSEKFDQRELYK